MSEPLAGFDWDAGNLAKCQQHGVSVEEIEALFDAPLLIVPDAAHSKTECAQLGYRQIQCRAHDFHCVHHPPEEGTATDSPHQRALYACQRGYFL